VTAEYQVDASNRLVHTTFSGVVEHRDPIENMLKLRVDPDFDPSFSELVEFTEDCQIRLNATHFRYLSQLDPFFSSSKRALVVGSRQSVYGSARMFQLLSHEHRRVKIFASMDEARLWLNALP